MSTIRNTHADDADAIRRIDAVAFNAWWQQVKGKESELLPRTRANVLACLEKDPDGCFVAEEDDQLVGFIFARTWGRVCWGGTFAVLPAYQRRGIGRQLIDTCLAYLRQGPNRVIGLETMPDSPRNLTLYMRYGFQPRLPSFVLKKPLNATTLGNAPDKTWLPRWSAADGSTQERWLTEMQDATARISPGYDYTREIISTERHKFGETLVLTKGSKAIGLSIIWLVSHREKPAAGWAHIDIAALHPAYTNEESLGELVEASEAFARTHGKQILTVKVNARHAWALERLLERGYHVWQSRIRMVLKGTNEGPTTDGYVNLSRWAG